MEHDGAITIPTPILVEAKTGDGGRDAEVNRVLKAMGRATPVLLAPDEATARLAGKLHYRARSDDGDNGIGALVAAATAGSGAPCVLLTSDPEDLGRLLANERQVVVKVV